MGDFERYLKEQREYQLARPNPSRTYADVMLSELATHLKTVTDWVNSDGNLDRRRMTAALDFFGSTYRAQGVIYRGTGKLVFDGQPASYTKSLKIAEGFGATNAKSGWFRGKEFYVIKRKAPSKSIDLKKLLKSYATCRIERCEEAEVIIFNTPVSDRNITEYS